MDEKKENPLQYMKRIASDLGVPESDLLYKKELFSMNEGKGEEDFSSIRVFHFHAPTLLYRSQERKGITLVSGSFYTLPRETIRDEGRITAISELLEELFLFALSGSIGVCKLVTQDPHIVSAQCHVSNFPQDFFASGRDYHGALLEMLTAYAGKK